MAGGWAVKMQKCTACRLNSDDGAEVVPGIPQDTGLVVLGSDIADGFATKLGSPTSRRLRGEEATQQADPMDERLQQARQLAGEIAILMTCTDRTSMDQRMQVTCCCRG